MKTNSIIGLVLILIMAISCKDETLEIQQAYTFKLTHLPIPSDVPENGTVEIRCTLETAGNYKEAIYKIRFFQNEGKGRLFLENMHLSVPNDLYAIEHRNFRLYYKAESKQNHQFDVYVEDTFGQTEKVSFEFGAQESKN
ncbi:TraQ conjugal transfer family protein [uncultured Polaribacter sp.]|uniref:TraQ conjugal transfer family protein n=1 Tax=uncultured Polaribacter sp. TaxID=174711 RepID=UPI0026399C07|nr:TraQ conjugal transfer family protein [uncultured Polaribacter sp.]